MGILCLWKLVKVNARQFKKKPRVVDDVSDKLGNFYFFFLYMNVSQMTAQTIATTTTTTMRKTVFAFSLSYSHNFSFPHTRIYRRSSKVVCGMKDKRL